MLELIGTHHQYLVLMGEPMMISDNGSSVHAQYPLTFSESSLDYDVYFPVFSCRI